MTGRSATPLLAELDALDPARVLFLGDTHGNAPFVDAACREARERGCSVVVQVGDFGLWPGPEGRVFLDAVSASATHHAIEFLWIDGNHEDHDQISRWSKTEPTRLRPHVAYLPRGLRWTWRGVRFGALGGAFSVDWRSRVPGQTWWPAETTTDADVERLGADPLDVLISHDSPAEMPMHSHWILKPADQAMADESRRMVQDAVDVTAPGLVIHGHWHQRRHRHLRFINETRSDADPTGAIHWSETQIEGLGADISDDPAQAWIVVELPALTLAIDPDPAARST